MVTEGVKFPTAADISLRFLDQTKTGAHPPLLPVSSVFSHGGV